MLKKICLLSIIPNIVVLLGCADSPKSSAQELRLSENWYLQSSAIIAENGKTLSTSEIDKKAWYPTKVPSTVLAALVKNEVYPDPYYGDNLKSIPGYRDGRWLAMKPDSPFYPSWWYHTEFQVPSSWEQKKTVLHFDGINYKVNIWLNGQQIADTSEVVGMFQRFEFDVNRQIKTGQKNVIAVEVYPPGRIPDIAYRTKQVEATTGWDDHNPQPPDFNMGLWEDVYITATGPVIIRNPYVVTDLDLPSLETAKITVSAELENEDQSEVRGIIKGQIDDIVFEKPVVLSAGEVKAIEFNPADFEQLVINEPRLWWPHPVGPQELYNLRLTFTIGNEISSKEVVRFGIREV